MVLAMHTESQTYVLAEPDLVNTSALKTLEGAQTAVALLDLIHAKDTPVVFDATLHGFARSRSLLRLLLEPPLVGATLVLVALAGLAGLQAGVRFGPALKPRRAVALGKLALADGSVYANTVDDYRTLYRTKGEDGARLIHDLADLEGGLLDGVRAQHYAERDEQIAEHLRAGRLLPVATRTPPEPIQMACLFTHLGCELLAVTHHAASPLNIAGD